MILNVVMKYKFIDGKQIQTTVHHNMHHDVDLKLLYDIHIRRKHEAF